MRSALLSLTVLASIVALPAFSQIEPTTYEAVDATGKVIGPVTTITSDRGIVPLVVDGHLIPVLLNRNFLDSTRSSLIYFASTDCSGQGYIDWSSPSFILGPYAIVTSSNSVYAGPRDQPRISIDYRSALAPGSDECEAVIGNLFPASAVSFVRNLNPPFQPPFDIRATGAPSAVSVPAVGLTGLAILASALTVLAFRRMRAARSPQNVSRSL